MNVFMGYNPTVAKQVKVSVWVKEIDGAEPILPAAPKDGDCFIVFDTDDDVLADNPSLKKSYANGSWGDAGGGGGGTSFPTFTKTGGSWTCDMTFEEAKEVYDANKLGARLKNCPCKKSIFGDTGWDVMMYMLRSDIEGTTQPPMPSDLVACLVSGDVLYGNDNNFYVIGSV